MEMVVKQEIASPREKGNSRKERLVIRLYPNKDPILDQEVKDASHMGSSPPIDRSAGYGGSAR